MDDLVPVLQDSCKHSSIPRCRFRQALRFPSSRPVLIAADDEARLGSTAPAAGSKMPGVG